ncbi:MAG TPA: FAD-linked oxidase C-terminal domain-containing protein [Acidimicrobiales bacterium]|nr:FAD-linked oxidase C-terminal domain-containing protein [Acidimicrobiales bacterium]
MSTLGELAARLRAALGDGAVLDDPAELRTYECDGLSHYRAVPGLVAFATSADAVATIVTACAQAAVPFVARGSGTGLSAGALPSTEGVLIVLAKMRGLVELDAEGQRAVVEPGFINLDVSRAAAPYGLFYAPDPSSQQICSIGGNVAENSGGAHCLKHGFTTHHVTGIELVTPSGEQVTLGNGKAPDAPGYDLLGAFVGSEGTIGILTQATLRLLPRPEAVVTLLAGFATTDEAGAAVSAIIASGVLPAAIEMMDALAILAAETAVHPGYPEGCGAVLLVELDGPGIDVAEGLATVEALCLANGASELRTATSEAERALLWKGRKSAFAAVGQLSPDFIVQDGVIPRTKLPEVLRAIDALALAAGIRVANVFHAGDGNLHPLVLFDESVEGDAERAEAVSSAIVDLCIAHGGSITGEHGVGADKVQFMGRMFGEDDLDTMQLLRCAFDPAGLSNPGKIFPTPRLCGEVPGRRGAHPLTVPGAVEVF